MRSRVSVGARLRRQSEANRVCRCAPRSHQAGLNALDVITCVFWVEKGLSGSNTVLDQVIDNGRVGQCRGITQGIHFVGCNFTQDSPHDLAGAGFWQAGCPLDDIRRGDWADFLANMGDQRFTQISSGSMPW